MTWVEYGKGTEWRMYDSNGRYIVFTAKFGGTLAQWWVPRRVTETLGLSSAHVASCEEAKRLCEAFAVLKKLEAA